MRHPTAPWQGAGPHRPGPAELPRELLTVSHALTDARNEDEILRLAMEHVPAVGPYTAEAGYLRVNGRLAPVPRAGTDHPPAVDRAVRELAGRDGPVDVPGRSPGRALAQRVLLPAAVRDGRRTRWSCTGCDGNGRPSSSG